MAIYPGYREVLPHSAELRCLDVSNADCPKSLGELLTLYKQEQCALQKVQEWRNIQSLFVTTIVPAIGGPAPKGRRASSAEIECSHQFLNRIAVGWLESASSVLEDIFDQLNIKKHTESKARSYIKTLTKWATQKGFIHQKERQIIYRHNEVTKSRPYIEDIPLMPGRPNWKNANALGCFESDYTQDTQHVEAEKISTQLYWNWKHCLSSLLKFPSLLRAPRLYTIICWVQLAEIERPWFLGNRELEQEFLDYIEFAETRLCHQPATIERDVDALRRYLGFLHRQQGVPLQEIRLNLIIPYTQLKPNRNLYRDEQGTLDRNAFRLAKIIALEDMEEDTEDLLMELDEFFSSCQVTPASAVNYMKSFINLGKKIYASQTTKFKAERGFEDIPLLESLRDRQAEFEQQHKANNQSVIPRELRLVPWTQLLESVEKARQELEETHRSHVRHSRVSKSGKVPVEKIERTDWARARNCQWFLMLAVMTANPPRRPRIYRQLEIGRTLVKGSFIHGVFVPASSMQRPAEAEWWIHLMPGDYKTGYKYGEWWGKLTNTVFRDGKTLYQYIDEWLTKWRPVFKPDHNNLFTQFEKGQPIESSDFRQRIERLCCRFAKVRVNPHSFRHIFITYLKSVGASESELESASVAMGHSRKIQSDVYNHLALQDRLRPSFDLTQTFNEAFYRTYKVVEQFQA
jgi:hypothetical protein